MLSRVILCRNTSTVEPPRRAPAGKSQNSLSDISTSSSGETAGSLSCPASSTIWNCAGPIVRAFSFASSMLTNFRQSEAKHNQQRTKKDTRLPETPPKPKLHANNGQKPEQGGNGSFGFCSLVSFVIQNCTLFLHSEQKQVIACSSRGPHLLFPLAHHVDRSVNYYFYLLALFVLESVARVPGCAFRFVFCFFFFF